MHQDRPRYGSYSHPFWVRGEGWNHANELEPGDELYTSTGGWVRVSGGTLLGRNQLVYNFEVAEDHTYFAGDLGVWVHNISRCEKRRRKEAAERERQRRRDEGVRRTGDDFVDLATPERRRHILDGDRTGGGHRPGTGKPGKSEFPQGWSDDRIMHEISDVATDPSLTRQRQRGGRTVVTGTRDGIDIKVVQEADGSIVTGHPTNVPRNPR